jgi:polysaccharide deacetylase family protein (PEP-CTERM system associated)
MPAPGSEPIVNAMSVDVEDYFQVSALADVAPRDSWDTFESRVAANTDRLLDLFAEAGVRATFFVLGWVADRHRALVRRIASAGHEIGSHGFDHRLVYDLGHEAFRDDVGRTRRLLEDVTGHAVAGYRAPSYSITRQSLWALDVLLEEGHRYDASIFPVHHDRYGIPDAPRHPHELERSGGRLVEVPPSTVRLLGVNLPVAGGGYFRLLPYAWTRWGIARLNDIERKPAVFYLHPWEIDPEQPRLKASWPSRVRHYRNLHKTRGRLSALCGEFRFAAIEDVLRASGLLEPSPGRQPGVSGDSPPGPERQRGIAGVSPPGPGRRPATSPTPSARGGARAEAGS